MDSESGCHAISERNDTTCCVEFVHSPLHSNVAEDSILRLDGNFAIWSQNELKEVLDTDITIFTAASVASEFSLGSGFFVPFSVGHEFTVDPDCVGTRVPVRNRHLDLTFVSSQDVAHVVEGSACVFDSVVAICLNE